MVELLGLILSLLTNEGTNSRTARIQKAESDITKAYWDSDRHNWTLSDYCTVHLNAQAKLDTIGIIRDGASQVHALMAGLKSDQIRSMAAIVVNDDTCNTDLQAATIKLQNLWNVLKPSQPLLNQQRGRGRKAGGDRNIGSTVWTVCGNT